MRYWLFVQIIEKCLLCAGKSSMLTEELESEKSDPPEAKWTSEAAAATDATEAAADAADEPALPAPPVLSIHLVIIDR